MNSKGDVAIWALRLAELDFDFVHWIGTNIQATDAIL